MRLLEGEREIGTLTAAEEGLYTRFTARGTLPDDGLWCVWLVGELGRVRLGVLEPRGTEGVLSRRLSRRETAPLGRLLRGELRPTGEPVWRNLTAEETKRLGKFPNARIRETEQGWELALPFDPKRPFPLTKLFCFAAAWQGEGERQVVYCFDKEGGPCLPPEKFSGN